MKIFCVSKSNIDNKCEIAKNAFYADSFFTRFMGLMLKKCFAPMDALIFHKCRSIHTYFMMFDIDVVCINAHSEVCDLVVCMVPRRIFMASRDTTALIECPQGTIEKCKINIGDVVAID